MKRNDQAAWGTFRVRRRMGIAFLLALPLLVPMASGQSGKEREEKKIDEKKLPEDKAPVEKPTRKPSSLVEVQFIDGSTMKLTLRDERIELTTPYGKLLIPVRDIERIEVATRIPDTVAKRIDAAIADLGHAEFKRREAATAELLELRERAYAALQKVEKSSDEEVARRAKDLLERIRDEVPEEILEFRPHDIIYTAESKFTGRLAPAAVKVQTFQFGEQQLKLADVRGLHSPSAAEAQPANAMVDPGNLNTLMGQIGTVHSFRVTGAGQGGQVVGAGPGGGLVIAGGGVAVWGTDIYTLDSSLALAAVHAGILKPGQTGVVRVKILGPQAAFQGSTRHGVTSQAFGPYNGGYQFTKGRGR